MALQFRIWLPRLIALVTVIAWATVAVPRKVSGQERSVDPPIWVVSSSDLPQSHDLLGTITKPMKSKCGRLKYYSPDSCGRLSQFDEASMLASIPDGIPICVVIHGSWVLLDDIGPESVHTTKWVRNAWPEKQVAVIFFNWPSGGVLTLIPNNPFTSALPAIDTAVLGRRADVNGHYLAQFLARLPPNPVCIVGHSHGARVTTSALHLLSGGSVNGRRLCGCVRDPGQRMRAVLAAAAIDHDWLNPGERFGRALCRVEGLLNLQTRCDVALKLYPLRRLFSGESLGIAGFTREDRHALGTWNSKAVDFDVTQWVGDSHMVTDYTRQPQIASAIREWVYFAE